MSNPIGTRRLKGGFLTKDGQTLQLALEFEGETCYIPINVEQFAAIAEAGLRYQRRWPLGGEKGDEHVD